MQVHVRDGKGGKDRLIPIPQRTLVALRCYWKIHRHPQLLFPGQGTRVDSPMDKGGVQKAMKKVLNTFRSQTNYTARSCLKQEPNTSLLSPGVNADITLK
jgi:integrase/recombinase XerD